jgi:hypothetical protein
MSLISITCHLLNGVQYASLTAGLRKNAVQHVARVRASRCMGWALRPGGGVRGATGRPRFQGRVIGQLAADADADNLIAEMLAATGGPPTDQEREAAHRLLGGSAA